MLHDSSAIYQSGLSSRGESANPRLSLTRIKYLPLVQDMLELPYLSETTELYPQPSRTELLLRPPHHHAVMAKITQHALSYIRQLVRAIQHLRSSPG